jgi:succinate dehydrogenase/fumarate reductase flavoprotein subunit
VQMVTNGSVETTQALMKAVDVVVATGGGAMVKAAYSSGKPSYGVGAAIAMRTCRTLSRRSWPVHRSTTGSSVRTNNSF